MYGKRLVFVLVVVSAVLVLVTSFVRKASPAPYPFPALFHFPQMPLSETNPVSVEGASLGRYLFYDPILSRDSNFSCSSCHRQSAAFSDANSKFSVGLRGEQMMRNTPPLFNLAWYPALFWDGRAANIEEQIFQPVRTHAELDMEWNEVVRRITASGFYREKFQAAFPDQKIDSVLVSKAIAQFLRTLLSYQSKYDKMLKGEAAFTKFEYEGFVLVNDQIKGNCLHCHTTDADALGTTRKFSNNGLDLVTNPKYYKDIGYGKITGQINDYGKFKIPSLRNVALTAPYMHDGRFKTLEEVLDFYSEGVHNSANIDPQMAFVNRGGMHLSPLEKQKIIAFLHTLTDSVFITNPEFSNPFLVH